ncbi:NAD(P)-binding protein, partial [Coprinopsis marcescibilis]
VTGITGFIAGHVAESFLKAGYRVRGTVRGAKAKILSKTVTAECLEFTQIDDVATSDFTEALKDVHAVIHVAAPLPGRTSVDDTLKVRGASQSSIDGTLNVLRQAEKLGITKFVVTSTFGACLDASLKPGFAGLTFTEKDWASASREDIIAQAENPYYVYFAAKALAEKAVWDFAKEYPKIRVSTVLPGFVFGPYADILPPPASKGELGTNGFPFGLINGNIPPVSPPWVVDVRDVAKAHLLAFELPGEPGNVEEQRFLVNAGNYTWKEAAAHLKQVLPQEIAAKVTDPETIPDLPGVPSTLDNTKAKAQLGIEFIAPEKTIEDAVLSLLEVQKTWA